jgi:hypothetical protein
LSAGDHVQIFPVSYRQSSRENERQQAGHAVSVEERVGCSEPDVWLLYSRQNGGNNLSPTNPASLYALDPNAAAKQMAALNSAGRARRATHGPSDDKSQSPNVSFATISSYQPPSNPTPSADPQQHPQQLNPQQQRQRQAFLHGLATFMSHRNNPLPPNVTGVPVPNFDPNTTVWKALEPGTEIGTFKLAGKNIDLFRLFNLALQAGGSNKVSLTSLTSTSRLETHVVTSSIQQRGVQWPTPWSCHPKSLNYRTRLCNLGPSFRITSSTSSHHLRRSG